MAIKSMDDLIAQAKGLTKEQLHEFLNNLSEEEQQVITDTINTQHKIHFTFIDDDFRDYTENEEELKRRVEDLEETIKGYNQEDLYYTKESILNPYILNVLAHCIKDTSEDLDADRLNELIGNYNKINNFINNDENYDNIIGFYGDIVNKDDNGFYEVNNAIIDKIIRDNDFNVKDDKEPIKDAINLTWENKKEILNPSTINDLSKEHNGINFKEFIFCEEYIKRGKIKPTCEYLGISRNTAYLWLKEKEVQEYLKKRQEEIKQETDDTFLQTYRASFNELNKMINSNGIETSDKIKAIDVFLKHYENIERLKQPQTVYED